MQQDSSIRLEKEFETNGFASIQSQKAGEHRFTFNGVTNKHDNQGITAL